ncbi:hypothetical protein C8R46DRAFT_1350372 [Mycena filopes]|nr:hypothetical protein C8R46DRAFT_1350372 [Mycena filopes]
MSTESDNDYVPNAGSDEATFTSNGGGIFAGSHHFTVAGGTFANTTNTYVTAPAVPPDFRMIPWGDIDLQRELLVNRELGVIGYQCERNCVRRVYSAKVDGRRSDVTVAVYQGDGAEEDWCRDVATYMSIRHPNIVQICAGASYGNIHATLFHGDLVPFKHYIAGCSPIVTVYLYRRLMSGLAWTRAPHGKF